MQFRLRTLLIVLAVGPVLFAAAWARYSESQAEHWARVRVVYEHECENPETSFDEWLKWRRSAEFREVYGDYPETATISPEKLE
jgi:hypothetical protein